MTFPEWAFAGAVAFAGCVEVLALVLRRRLRRKEAELARDLVQRGPRAS